MLKQFETERYDLVKADKVRVSDHRFGHNKKGELDVWIESSGKGERFLSRLIFEGESFAVRKEVYTGQCYILREKITGRYWFLDMNDCGYWLHSDTFFGAKNYSGDETARIEKWLSGASQLDAKS